MDILLISTSEHLHDIVSKVLTRDNFRVHCFSSCDEARRWLPENEWPDLAILFDSRNEKLVFGELSKLRQWLDFRPILVAGQAILPGNNTETPLGMTQCLPYPVSGRALLKATVGALNLHTRQNGLTLTSHPNQLSRL